MRSQPVQISDRSEYGALARIPHVLAGLTVFVALLGQVLHALMGLILFATLAFLLATAGSGCAVDREPGTITFLPTAGAPLPPHGGVLHRQSNQVGDEVEETHSAGAAVRATDGGFGMTDDSRRRWPGKGTGSEPTGESMPGNLVARATFRHGRRHLEPDWCA